MRARFEIADAALAQASFRKAGRWSRVITGRAAQGRCTVTESVNVSRATRTIEFDWPKEQHAWMRRFLGRFARAWLPADFGPDDRKNLSIHHDDGGPADADR